MNFGGTQLAHNNIYFLYFKGYSIKLQKRENCPTRFINLHWIPKLDNKKTIKLFACVTYNNHEIVLNKIFTTNQSININIIHCNNQPQNILHSRVSFTVSTKPI